MFKLPLDSLLTVAQPSPQLIEVQVRSQQLTTLMTHDQHAHTLYVIASNVVTALSSICQLCSIPRRKSCGSTTVGIAAFLEPVVIKSFVMFRCCCQTGVLASYAYKQAMQAAQLLSCMMPWQRYFPAL